MTPFLTVTVLLLVSAQDPTPRTWDVDGVKREALVYAPAKKSEGKVPLVFDFHGHGGTAKHAARTRHFTRRDNSASLSIHTMPAAAGDNHS